MRQSSTMYALPFVDACETRQYAVFGNKLPERPKTEDVMADNDLDFRIKRIYAAINAVQETNLKTPARVIETDTRVGFVQDFTGQLNREELTNHAQTAIALVAGFQDHLRGWAKQTAHNEARVKETRANSLALRIVWDLWNNEKHVYPPRDGGLSGCAPRVERVTRRMRLTTGPEEGSSCAITFTPQGRPVASGPGTAILVTTGDLVDRDKNPMGDLYSVLLEAVAAWEALLAEFGVPLPKTANT